MTERERRSEIGRRAWETRRANRPLREASQEERRLHNQQLRQRNQTRETWITEWFGRHRPELGDDETIDKTVDALRAIFRFVPEMDWLRENPEALHEDHETTDNLMVAIEVIRRFTFPFGVVILEETATVHEPSVPPSRRRMRL